MQPLPDIPGAREQGPWPTAPLSVCSGHTNYELECPNLAAGKTKELRAQAGRHPQRKRRRDYPFGPHTLLLRFLPELQTAPLVLLSVFNDGVKPWSSNSAQIKCVFS